MSCNPTVNSFNHFLEQYVDWSKCELKMCDKEISCRKCKENMLSVYNNKIRKEERERMLSIVSRCIPHNVYNVSEGIALLNEIKEEINREEYE